MRRNDSEHLSQTEFLSSVMPQNPTNGTMSALNVTRWTMLTKGLSADALLESNRWIKGPDFLWQNEDSCGLKMSFVLVKFPIMTLR